MKAPTTWTAPIPPTIDGAARVIHLTRTASSWASGSATRSGRASLTPPTASPSIPANGDVWVGDREQYRIVVYTRDGKFLRTMSMKNLVCALNFDHQGNPWMASGQDGQFLKLTRDGKVIGAVGNGMGIGTGQFIEASYWVFDKHDNLIAGDTSVGRVTVMSK